MRKTRFTEEQIIGLLKQAEAGTRVDELSRKHGFSPWTFYRWRSKYGGMAVPDARRLRELEDENRRLKKLVADQALDRAAAEGSLGKKVVTPEAKRRVVGFWRAGHSISERRACRLLNLCRASCRYRRRPDRNVQLRSRLRVLPSSGDGSGIAGCRFCWSAKAWR